MFSRDAWFYGQSTFPYFTLLKWLIDISRHCICPSLIIPSVSFLQITQRTRRFQLHNSPLPRDVHIHVFSGFVLHDEKLECDTEKEGVLMKIRVEFVNNLHWHNFDQISHCTAENSWYKVVRCMKICLKLNLCRINDIHGLNLMEIKCLPRCMNCCGISPNKKEEKEREGEVDRR